MLLGFSAKISWNLGTKDLTEDWAGRPGQWSTEKLHVLTTKDFSFPLVVMEAINRSQIRNDIIAIKFSSPQLFQREKCSPVSRTALRPAGQFAKSVSLWPLSPGDQASLIRSGDQNIFSLRLKIFRLRTRNIFIRFNCDPIRDLTSDSK